MPDITNYDGRLEQMAYYCEAMLDNIAKVNNAYHDSVETLYAKTLPDHLIKWKVVKQIGGRTIVWNQLAKSSMYRSDGDTVGGMLITHTSQGFTAVGIKSSSYSTWLISADVIANHKYYVAGTPVDTGITLYCSAGSGEVTVTDGFIVTATSTHIYIGIVATSGTSVNLDWKPQIVDLTLLYGAGNEPSTVDEFKEWFPADWYAHNDGSLLSAGITSVISKDSNNDTLQTYSIPAEITTLEGDGWSCPGAYNYIDFTNKKFVYAVGIRAYEAGDESDATVITDGTNTHYELEEPLSFDVELPGETITQAKSGGNLIFANQHGDDYHIPVPVELEYIGVS